MPVRLRGMPDIVLILHDIRSIHNVGSLLRTAECFGVNKVIFTGYTPFPQLPSDDRLPHIYQKTTRQIHKTALGAETMLPMDQRSDINKLLNELKADGYRLVGLEQANNSIQLNRYTTPKKTAVLIGREVEGVDPKLLNKMDDIVEIPLHGQKESLNVVQATAVALYQLIMV